MLTIRSWTAPPSIVRSLARTVRAVYRRTLRPDPSVSHVDVVVFSPVRASPPDPVSEPTATSISRAADEIGSIEVTIRCPSGDLPPIAPDLLWVFLLDGAELETSALSTLVETFDANPDLDMAYGDASVRAGGEPVEAGSADEGPWLLPGFSPERLADQFYLGHLVALRPHRLGRRNRPGSADGPWPYVAMARTVAHVPEPLYRPAPSVGWWQPEAPASVDSGKPAGAVSNAPLVSVVIPTNGSIRDLDRGPVRLVDQAVRSVLRCSYPNIEIVVVLTPGHPDDLAMSLRDLVEADSGDGRRLNLVIDDRPFNFSNACNRGAANSTGDVLVFLNDDTEVLTDDWLAHLTRHARHPEVGAVGARLLYEDGRVQHTGIWSRGGHPTHRYEGWPSDAEGYLGALRVAQNCLAVTGACLAVERSKFELVGGFSPIFPNSYNDVDLCLKLWDRGYRTVVEPRAELHHFEASTRDPAITDDDLATLHDRWRWRLNNDPFDNPNHTAERSEEWPLPTGFDPERPQPRFWPLVPLNAASTR